MLKKLCFLILILFCSIKTNAQNWSWALSEGGLGNEYWTSIAIDSTGNTFISGNISGTAYFENDTLGSTGGYIAKYDQVGNMLWVRNIGGASVNSIGLDSFGNIFICGEFNGLFYLDQDVFYSSYNSSSSYLAKFDNNGNYLWGKQSTPFSTSNSHTMASNLAVNSSNEILVKGTIYGTAFFGMNRVDAIYSQTFIEKFDSNGNVDWVRTIVQNFNNFSIGFGGLGCDNFGNCYLSDVFTHGVLHFGSDSIINSSANSTQSYIAKINSTGNFTWVKQFAGTSSTSIYCIDVDQNGNCYFGGNFFGTQQMDATTLYSSNNGPIFIAKCDSVGNIVWAKNGGHSGYCRSITTNTSGECFAGIHCSGVNCTFSPLTISGYGGVIVKFGVTGNPIGATSGIPSVYFSGLEFDSNNNLYATGNFYQTAAFDNDILSAYGGSDIFLAKSMEITEVPEYQKSSITNLSIFPNPTNSASTIYFSLPENSITDISLFNLEGELVLLISKEEMNAGENSITVNLEELKSGVYIVKVNSESFCGQNLIIKTD